MNNLTLFSTSVGRKLLTGITGIVLICFLIIHLIGNFNLFLGADAFNAYAHFLMTFLHGQFIILAEAGLLLLLLVHIIYGVRVYINKKKARQNEYSAPSGTKGNSKKTWASLNMIITGVVLSLFIVVHLKHFKFGPQYSTVVHGEEMRDVYRLVIEFFQNLGFVLFYVVTMLLLGLHLKHGAWSALQSIGATRTQWLPYIYSAGMFFGILLGAGFVILPILIYIFY